MAAGGAMCDYEGLVGDPGPGFDPRALLGALGVGRYDFSHVLGDSPAFAPFGRGQELSWIVDAPEGYEAYAAERRAAGVSVLKELDRKRRKVEREIGAPVFTARSASVADFERLIVLKREQYRATSQTDVLRRRLDPAAAAGPVRAADDRPTSAARSSPCTSAASWRRCSSTCWASALSTPG